jgi:hypothetical protein
MDAVPRERLSALIDKEPMLILGLGSFAVFSDVHVD